MAWRSSDKTVRRRQVMELQLQLELELVLEEGTYPAGRCFWFAASVRNVPSAWLLLLLLLWRSGFGSVWLSLRLGTVSCPKVRTA